MAGGRKRKASEGPAEDAAVEEALEEFENPGAVRAEANAKVARSRAAHFAHFTADDEDDQDNVHTGADAARTLGPWSSAVELVNARDKAVADREDKILARSREVADSKVPAWQPTRDVSLGPRAGCSVLPLFEMCLDIITEYIDCVSTLEGVPDAVRVRVAASVCQQRKMTPEVVRMFSVGLPGEVVIRDCTQLDPASLCTLLQECASDRLERLELRFCGRGMADEAAAVLARAQSLPRLTSLHLGGAYRLTDVALQKILSVTPNLASLSLPSASRLTGSFIEKLPALVPMLRQLHLSECRGVSGESLCKAVPQLMALQALSVDTIDEVTDAALAIIARGPCLKELSLCLCQGITDVGLAAIAKERPSLEVLLLDDCSRITDRGLAELATSCKSLRVLSLRRCHKLSDAALAELAGRGALQQLSVAGIAAAGPALMASLTLHCRDSLESLDLSFCRGVPEGSLGTLADRCTRLKRLRLFGCSQVTRHFLHGHSNDVLAEVVGTGTECN